jgi:4-carboxymuconolactone decarboxylase
MISGGTRGALAILKPPAGQDHCDVGRPLDPAIFHAFRRDIMITRKIACAAAVLLTGIAAAMAADVPQFKLRGDRFKPLTWEEMSPEQQAMVDHLLSGPRGSTNGPFNVMLRSPELGDRLQSVGAYVIFKNSLSDRLKELTILTTARAWTAQYVWHAHYPLAMKAGLPPAVAKAIAEGKQPPHMSSEDNVVYKFTRELIDTKRVSDATFAAAKAKFGERGVVDLIGTIGYYQTVAMLVDVDRYPLPDGAKLPLRPLKH